MRYFPFVILVVAAYLWFAPSTYPYVQPARDTLSAYSARAMPDETTVRNAIGSLRDRIRDKAMELLRKELHQSVDELVK